MASGLAKTEKLRAQKQAVSRESEGIVGDDTMDGCR